MPSEDTLKRIDYIKKDEAIIDALTELLLTKSIEKISINEITKTAKINRGTFYLHYDDKYQVMEALEKRLLLELSYINKNLSTLKFAEIDTQKPYPFFVETYKWVLDNKKYIAALLSGNGDLSFALKWKKLIYQHFSGLLGNNGVKSQYFELVLHGIAAILMEYINQYIHMEDPLSPDEMSMLCGRMVHGMINLLNL